MHSLVKIASCASLLALSVSSTQAQIGAIGTVDTLTASQDYGVLAQVGPFLFYPYLFVSAGAGTGTSIGADVQDFFTGYAAADIGYTLSGLNLDESNFTSGGLGGTSFSPYLPGMSSTFAFTLDGDTIAVGEIQTFNIFTNYDTGVATGEGTILITGPGVGPDFYSVINALTGGQNIVNFTINSFNALDVNPASGQFASDGEFTFPAPIPEPSTYAALVGAIAMAGVALRRRRSV